MDAGAGSLGGRLGRSFAVSFLIAGAVGFQPDVVSAQGPESIGLTEALRAERSALEMSDGTLVGPGWERLGSALDEARYIAIGEEHGFVEVSRFVGAVWDRLARQGEAPRLGIENGRWATARLNEPDFQGSPRRIAAFLEEHPAALAFDDDPELRLYARVTDGCGASCDRLWGLDQPFGATHVLEAVLDSLSPEETSPELRDELEGLLREARRFDRPDRSSRYLYGGEPAEELEQAAEALAREGHPGAAERVADLARSARIYDDFRTAGEGQPTGLRSNARRELDMKRRLIQHLERSARTGFSGPVMVKMGAVHLYRGFGPTNVLTLGNFLHETAIREGGKSVHVAVFPRVDARSLEGTSAEWAAPLMAAGFETGWTLIDLRGLPSLLHAGQLSEVSPTLARLIRGFDFVVLFANPTPSTRELTER